MTTTLICLAGAALLLVLLVLWDRHKNKDRGSLSQNIRTWPWTDTFLGIAVLLSGWTVVFYEGCLVFMQTASFAPFTEAMQPVFNFLNIMLGTSGLTAIGRRATTKTDVIEAHARNGMTGEMPIPPQAGA